jgi:N-acetylglucosaminyl-diphospho-decaprenol L-rhamnosyltransferase
MTDAQAPGLRHKLLRTGANLGFGKACNLGAAGSTARYLLFLNPDAALLEGALPKAVALMESEQAAGTGICGIQLVGDDGLAQHHTATFPTPRTIFTHQQRQTPFDHLHSRKVDHVIGAFYLIRRGVFEALGGFDERFFVYLEDVDLSRRARDAGWESFYLAEAKAYHKGGGTSDQVKAKRLFYAMRSRILYAFKHFSRPQAWGTLLVTILLEPFPRLLRALVRRSGSEISETLSGFRMLIADLPNIRRTVTAVPGSSTAR